MKVTIVAAGIVYVDEVFLIAQIMPTRKHAGLWEFPGGKVEQGEGLDEALTRELDEELGITAVIGDLVYVAPYFYDPKSALISFLAVESYRGQLRCREHTDIKWVTHRELIRMWTMGELIAPNMIAAAEQFLIHRMSR